MLAPISVELEQLFQNGWLLVIGFPKFVSSSSVSIDLSKVDISNSPALSTSTIVTPLTGLYYNFIGSEIRMTLPSASVEQLQVYAPGTQIFLVPSAGYAVATVGLSLNFSLVSTKIAVLPFGLTCESFRHSDLFSFSIY